VRACTLDCGDAEPWRSFQNQATEALLDAEARSDDKPLRRCPAERCNFTFVHEQAETTRGGALFICPACTRAFCLACPVVNGGVGPAHDGPCSRVVEEINRDADRRRKLDEWRQANGTADKRFAELLRREAKDGLTKPCPQCKTPITKNAGCDHMHCTVCGHHYSWTSGQSMMNMFGGGGPPGEDDDDDDDEYDY